MNDKKEQKINIQYMSILQASHQQHTLETMLLTHVAETSQPLS